MKRAVVLLIAIVLLLCACGRAGETSAPVVSAPPTIPRAETQPQKRPLRFSVTEMLADSPMLSQLLERFSEESGYPTDVSVNTDSVAVSVAETGKMDILIAQKGTDASRFLAAGYADFSAEWLTDRQVLAGPHADPAQVADAQTMQQSLQRIAKTGSAFVSRYDDSDVSRKEMRLWSSCGISIGNGKRWYKALRLSMTASLRNASAMGAYVYADLETFLRDEQDLQLEILQKDLPELQTTYCILPVSQDRFPSVNTQGVQAFLSFLQQTDTQDFIRSYGLDSYGCSVFTVQNF